MFTITHGFGRREPLSESDFRILDSVASSAVGSLPKPHFLDHTR